MRWKWSITFVSHCYSYSPRYHHNVSFHCMEQVLILMILVFNLLVHLQPSYLRALPSFPSHRFTRSSLTTRSRSSLTSHLKFADSSFYYFVPFLRSSLPSAVCDTRHSFAYVKESTHERSIWANRCGGEKPAQTAREAPNKHKTNARPRSIPSLDS